MDTSDLERILDDELKRQAAAAGLPWPPPPPPRDFVPCRWCGGRGCIACAAARRQREEELDAEYRRQFPDGPQPIFSARLDNPAEMESLRRVAGLEAIEKAFGLGGGGMAEIEANATREREQIG